MDARSKTVREKSTLKLESMGSKDARQSPIASSVLAAATEGNVVRLALALYGTKNPHVNPDDAMALVLKNAGLPTSPKTIMHAKEGRSFLGLDRWLVIEKEIGYDLYHVWYHLKICKECELIR